MLEMTLAKRESPSRAEWEGKTFAHGVNQWEQQLAYRHGARYIRGRWKTTGIIKSIYSNQHDFFIVHLHSKREVDEALKSGFRSIRVQLIELQSIDDEDIVPTPKAFAKTWQLISRVGRRLLELGHAFPDGYVMEDGEGGIRIEWEGADGFKHVRLSIHADPGEEDYIYYEGIDGRGIDTVSFETLTGWLSWFAA